MGMLGGCDSGKWNFDLGDWIAIIALIGVIVLLVLKFI
mgnify:CR=1 FL=1